MPKEIQPYAKIITQLKSAILKSRYKAAVLVNKKMLVLYLTIGKLISQKAKQEKWGAKSLEHLSEGLQKELPGLRGFSASNIKKMRVFYEVWSPYFQIGSTPSNQFEIEEDLSFVIGSTLSNQFAEQFFCIGFSHHYEIISTSTELKILQYYINEITINQWSVATLRNNIRGNLHVTKGALPNNFSLAIANSTIRAKALQSFKDEYLLDFINIEDADEADERLIENEVVRNIKKFILSIGADFAFMGNQYRVKVEDEEYFVDLLFFNRKLQCLVAFELKKGKFKPEYLGKMNFYLSALDEYVKQPHEQPSIGIILCKEKTNKVVEFSFRDFTKPMGVATYKTSSDVPKQFKGILPNAASLKKMMDK
ncbi:MAG: DUF1016 family protein [Deinococcales bacterium]|nr:DUF1016 family protein [Chitinophagaceae bacterium]